MCSFPLVIKLVFVIRRREDLTPQEFHRYWLEEHGPLSSFFVTEEHAFIDV
jgi:hypothetical protein